MRCRIVRTRRTPAKVVSATRPRGAHDDPYEARSFLSPSPPLPSPPLQYSSSATIREDVRAACRPAARRSALALNGSLARVSFRDPRTKRACARAREIGARDPNPRGNVGVSRACRHTHRRIISRYRDRNGCSCAARIVYSREFPVISHTRHAIAANIGSAILTSTDGG